jgi:NDP-sugar pyrophosphorylase family protein
MSRPTQAVILVGGEGTRLRPLTNRRAKPVVPLLDRPFLEYQITLLREHGVTDIIVACWYRVQDIKDALGDGRPLGVRIRYVIETTPLGTGGGVRNAADLTSGVVFVLNGDVLTDANLSDMRQFHEARGSRTTIYLTRVADPSAYGLVETAPDGRLQAFREKPKTPEEITTDTINAGIYLIDAELLRRIPLATIVSIEREFFPALIADGVPCYGWIGDAYWRDIGNVAAYRAAQFDLLTGTVRSPLLAAGATPSGDRIASDVRLAPDARVESPSFLAAGVVIESGARVGPFAVVGAGCRVGERARVERAILWPRVTVGPGAILRGCVIGDGARIAAGAEVGEGATVESDGVVPNGVGPLG